MGDIRIPVQCTHTFTVSYEETTGTGDEQTTRTVTKQITEVVIEWILQHVPDADPDEVAAIAETAVEAAVNEDSDEIDLDALFGAVSEAIDIPAEALDDLSSRLSATTVSADDDTFTLVEGGEAVGLVLVAEEDLGGGCTVTVNGPDGPIEVNLPPEAACWSQENVDYYASQMAIYLANPPAVIDIDPVVAADTLARADVVSQRARAGERSFTMQEYQVVFDAAEILTGVPADIMRTYAWGEGIGSYYEEPQYPRQFLEPDDMFVSEAGVEGFPELNSRYEGTNGWPLVELDGVPIPVTIGDDTRFTPPSDSLGLGIMALTFSQDSLLGAGLTIIRDGEPMTLDGDAPPLILGPGPANNNYSLDMTDVDLELMLVDPYYNVLMFTQLVLFNTQANANNLPSEAQVADGDTSYTHPVYGDIIVRWDDLPDNQAFWLDWVGAQKGSAGSTPDNYAGTFLAMMDEGAPQYEWVTTSSYRDPSDIVGE